jgi:hypothetical protein
MSPNYITATVTQADFKEGSITRNRGNSYNRKG